MKHSERQKLLDDILAETDVGARGREILRETLLEHFVTGKPWHRVLGFSRHKNAQDKRDGVLREIWRHIRKDSKTAWAACESVHGGLLKFEREIWTLHHTADSPLADWTDLQRQYFWVYFYNREFDIKIPRSDRIRRLMIESNEYS